MRVQDLLLLLVPLTVGACAGPSAPGDASAPLVYRTGSRLPQPDGPQPGLSYLNAEQLSRSPNFTVSGAFIHSPVTPLPPPPEPQAP